MGFKDIEINSKEEHNSLESIEIALTSMCNFNCSYCGAYKNEDNNKKLDVEVIKNTVSGLQDIQRVKLSGGEVTLFFKECLEIIRFCKDKGIQTQINTNGSVLDHNKIDQLVDAGLNYIHFSLNHLKAETHNKYYRKGEHTFDIIVENIKYFCQKDNVEVITETILFEETIPSLEELYDFIYDLGVRKLQLQTPVSQNGWEANQEDSTLSNCLKNLILNKHDDVEFYITCVSVDRRGDFFKEIEEVYKKGKIFFPYCVEGKNQLHLHSNGDILICDIGKPTVLGNIFTGDSLSTFLEDKADILSEMTTKCNCTRFL
jgi:MoaA/NifB/PqqE/SkfB family radical SAM enzyme